MLNIRYKVTNLALIGCDHTPVIPDLIHLNNMLMTRYLFFWLQHVNSKIWQYAASAATSIAALLLNPANPDEDGSPGYTGHHHLLCLPGTIELRVTGKRFALHIISRWVRVLEGIISWKISNNVSFSTPTKRGQLPSNQSSRKTLGKLGW